SCILSLQACRKEEASLNIFDLQTEYSENPLGIDVPAPCFSWKLSDSLNNARQQSYLVLVASEPDLLTFSKADMWNSGWEESSQTNLVAYKGRKLESGKKYYWKVFIKDNYGRESTNTSEAFFETGLLEKDDWKAYWISFAPEKESRSIPPDGHLQPGSIMLRKEFAVQKPIKQARVYISGLGGYILYLNGERIGNDIFTQSRTDFKKGIPYQTYDITEFLVKGENAAGILLGNKWWSDGPGWKNGQTHSKGILRAIAQIHIIYKNGKEQTLITDKSWRGYPSPIIHNSIDQGETYDARLEIPLWNEPGLEDSKWYEVKEIRQDTFLLSAQKEPITKVRDIIIPVTVKEVKPGIFVYDMGINMLGFARLKVEGENSDTITMKFGELLHDDGTVRRDPHRSAIATDRYILKGTGMETWQPSFTYRSFRYIQVEGFPAKPGRENISGIKISISGKDGENIFGFHSFL
ncbi:MAG: family 78 glycoside hydrolase catalytic domain, partial [Bacteroidota bacterium]